jgi:hypothetical protein
MKIRRLNDGPVTIELKTDTPADGAVELPPPSAPPRIRHPFHISPTLP